MFDLGYTIQPCNLASRFFNGSKFIWNDGHVWWIIAILAPLTSGTTHYSFQGEGCLGFESLR